MTTLHVLSVFVGPDGRGGNPLGVFLDGRSIDVDRRQGVAASLGFPETVFVDDVATGTLRIYLPNREAAFAGHPMVGTAWLLAEIGVTPTVMHPPAGAVAVRRDGQHTWIRGRAAWSPGAIRIVELHSAHEVETHPGQRLGEPWLYVWAWEDEAAGRLRSRSFPTDLGIVEDEATGSASIVMGDRLDRPLVIHQGLGSEILVRPCGDGWFEVGGRTELVETRAFD